jgi:putative transposon-encoded protein
MQALLLHAKVLNMEEYKDDVIEILNNGDFEDIFLKQITNSSNSGRVFIPKKYLGMDAIIIIHDPGICLHCNGKGKCNCPDCVFESGARLIRRRTLIPITCQKCKGSGNR